MTPEQRQAMLENAVKKLRHDVGMVWGLQIAMFRLLERRFPGLTDAATEVAEQLDEFARTDEILSESSLDALVNYLQQSVFLPAND